MVILRADVEDAAVIVNDACGSVAGDYRVETFSADYGIESAAGGVAFDELGIAVIDHPDAGVSANIASTLMERAEFEDRIPEFYAFADSAPMYVLVVAAAGNDSARKLGHVAPVGSPADCPSVVAVGAVDQALDVADFSNGDINGGSGTIDVVAPGVDVLSSWPLPRRHRSISGTSMACPHAAAVAALWLQSSGNVGQALRNQLCNQALSLGAADTGYGLVQAP